MMRHLHAPCLLLLCLCHCDEPDEPRIESVTPLRVPLDGREHEIRITGRSLSPATTLLVDGVPTPTRINSTDRVLVAAIAGSTPGLRGLQVRATAKEASAPFARPLCLYQPWKPVSKSFSESVPVTWLEAINPAPAQHAIMKLISNSAAMVALDATTLTPVPFKPLSFTISSTPSITFIPSLAAFAQLLEAGQAADLLMAENIDRRTLVARCTYQEAMIGEFSNRCMLRTEYAKEQRVTALALGTFGPAQLASVVAGIGPSGTAFVDVVMTDRSADRRELSRSPIMINQLKSPTALLIAPLFPASFTAEPQILIADRDVIYISYAKDNQHKLVSLPLPSGGVPSAVAAADLDGDGLLDIIVSSSSGLRVFWSTPLPDPAAKPDEPPVSFRSDDVATSCSNPSRLLVKDLDGDTMPDLITVGSAAPKLCVRFNDCAGGFEAEQIQTLKGSPTGLSAAYLDLNSSLDLVLAEKLSNNNVLEVLFNDGK